MLVSAFAGREFILRAYQRSGAVTATASTATAIACSSCSRSEALTDSHARHSPDRREAGRGVSSRQVPAGGY